MPLTGSIRPFRNKLAYPAGWLPGFDPSHPAAMGGIVRCSAACVPGFYINPLNGTIGANTSMTSVMDGIIGPALTAGATASVSTFNVLPATSDSQVTMAAIFRMGTTITNFAGAVSSNSSAQNVAGWTMSRSSTGVLQFGTSAGKTAIQSVVNTAYFYAASGIVGSIVNWAVTNLQTGQIYSGTAGTPGTLPGGGRNLLDIGTFDTNSSEQWGGPIATAMYSTAFLSVAQLQAWAADPWAFWYPIRTPIDWVGKIAAVAAPIAFVRRNIIRASSRGFR